MAQGINKVNMLLMQNSQKRRNTQIIDKQHNLIKINCVKM